MSTEKKRKNVCVDKSIYLRPLGALDGVESNNPFFLFKIKQVDFSWEGDGTLPQNSYKPSQDLLEAPLQKRTRSF